MTSVDGTRAEGPATNIRHDLEPALVQAQVQKRLAALEARLPSPGHAVGMEIPAPASASTKSSWVSSMVGS